MSASKSQDEMESRLLLDIVIRKGSAILKLFTGEDKSLLIWWDTFLVLDLGLDVFDGVCWLDIEGYDLTSEGLDEDVHITSNSSAAIVWDTNGPITIINIENNAAQ